MLTPIQKPAGDTYPTWAVCAERIRSAEQHHHGGAIKPFPSSGAKRVTKLDGNAGSGVLHEAIARDHGVGVALATMLLEAGARLDVRDRLLASTPLGWACRWGRTEIVELLLARGADSVEGDAEPWAAPRAWAEKMRRPEIVALLDGAA